MFSSQIYVIKIMNYQLTFLQCCVSTHKQFLTHKLFLLLNLTED